MVNYGVLVSAVLFVIAALIPDHPHNDNSMAFCFLLGSFSFSIAVVFELVRLFGG
jgi:hypothetical protein